MIKIGGNTAQKVFSKKSGTKGRKTMKLSLKMALTLGFISAFVICVMNICTVHNTRISFTQALDKNMEDKGRASSEELSSMISKMNAISSIILFITVLILKKTEREIGLLKICKRKGRL